MVRQNDPFWDFVEKLDDGPFICTFCGYKFAAATSVSRIKWHFSGVKGRGVKICHKVPEDVQDTAHAAIDGSPEKKLKTVAGSSNNEVTNAISASAQEHNNKVMAQQGEALSDKELEEWIASIPVEELTLRHSSPEELLPNEFQTAPRTERAHQDREGRTSDISSLFMEDNVVCNSIENTTTGTGLMQHSERGSSHERLSINQVETHGDSTHPTDLPCLDLGIHYDHLCPSSLNNDVIMNDVKNMIRESGQLVVRGSSHEWPLVNCDEPQGDSSQPTDQPCHNLGRYHDQLCTPLVNMVGDPGGLALLEGLHETYI